LEKKKWVASLVESTVTKPYPSASSEYPIWQVMFLYFWMRPNCGPSTSRGRASVSVVTECRLQNTVWWRFYHCSSWNSFQDSTSCFSLW
jgi:hypothetical protein